MTKNEKEKETNSIYPDEYSRYTKDFLIKSLARISITSDSAEEVRRKIIEELNYPYKEGAIAVYQLGDRSFKIAIFHWLGTVSI